MEEEKKRKLVALTAGHTLQNTYRS